MELHESLYALGRSQGRELFNDADSFRGALDDYLDEDSASTGDINLLVDAVRLGAFQAMMSMLDSGADADRAVTEAGSRLARDRGSADVGGAMWALAVLGYATGKVSDVQVRRYRTQHASAPTPPPAGPATMLPPAAPGSAPAPPPGASAPPPGVSAPPPVSSPPPTTPVWPSSGPNPGVPGSVAPAPAAATSYGAPPPSYGGYSHAAAPPKKRKAAAPPRPRRCPRACSWSSPSCILGRLPGGRRRQGARRPPGVERQSDRADDRRGPGRLVRGAQRALPEPRGAGDLRDGQLRGRRSPVGPDREDRVHLPAGHAGADDVLLRSPS